MKTARLPAAWHNLVILALSLLVTASYCWQLRNLSADIHKQSPHGYEGEAAFIIVIPLYFLMLYAGFFSLVALERVVRRNQEHMPKSDLLLGLLPMWLWLLWLLFHGALTCYTWLSY